MTDSTYETRKKEEIDLMVKSFTYHLDESRLHPLFIKMIITFVKTKKIDYHYLTYDEVLQLTRHMRTTLCNNVEFLPMYPSVLLLFLRNYKASVLPNIILLLNIDRLKNEVVMNAEITLDVPMKFE